MVPLVFKTSVGPRRSRVGSIPIRLRHFGCEISGLRLKSESAMEKRRAILALVLGAAGLTLFVYGVFCHAGDVWPADDPTALASGVVDVDVVPALTSESAMIREVTIGGLKRDMAGSLRKTYSGQAPKACPT